MTHERPHPASATSIALCVGPVLGRSQVPETQAKLCYQLAQFVLEGVLIPGMSLAAAQMLESSDDPDLIALASVYPGQERETAGLDDALRRLAARLCGINNTDDAFRHLVTTHMRRLASESVAPQEGALQLYRLYFSGMDYFGGEVAATDELLEMMGLYSEWEDNVAHRPEYEARMTASAREFFSRQN